jgi:hypothetical protein
MTTERKPRRQHERSYPCAHGRLQCAYCPSDVMPTAKRLCPVCHLAPCNGADDRCMECEKAGLEALTLFDV